MNLSISNFVIKYRFACYMIGGYLVSCLVGFLIIQDNPFLLLMSLSLPFGIILFTNPKISFYVIMFSVFFADWFMNLGWIPPEMTLLPEVTLVILFIRVVIIRAMDRKFIKTPLNLPILFLVSWGLISMLVNSQNIVTTMIGFRYDFKYVLMFFLLINLNPEEKFFKRMIFTLIVLLLIQIPVALVKLTIYGQGEWAIGTYGIHIGTYSTILPLIAISIFLGFFIFENPRLHYIFFCLLFFLFAIIGRKRAFVFFMVLLFLFLFSQFGKKNFAKFSFLAPIIVIGALACVYFIPELNPAFQNPRHLVDFSVSYSTDRNVETGSAIGRSSALLMMYNVSTENLKNFLVGFGPGTMAPTYFKEFERNRLKEFNIDYGGSQVLVMCLEYGWMGALLFLGLFIPLFRVSQKFFASTTDNYWKAISFGFKGILFSYLMGAFYSVIFRLDLSAFIFWFFAAAICCLAQQKEMLPSAVN